MLKKLKVADINLEIDLKYNRTLAQSKEYEADFDEYDISIDIPESDIESVHNENPYLTNDDIEYIYTGASFYEGLLHFKGFMLHSSGVVVDNYAYLFSADPGTGKSTHTDLWVKYFGQDKAKIINDDKPAIRMIDDKLYVYGTPWSGKTDQNINMKVPIGAIVFLERSEENWVKEITPAEAIPLILQQTVRPKDSETMIKLLDMLDIVLRRVKLFKLGCNMSEDAVKVSYNGIKVEV